MRNHARRCCRVFARRRIRGRIAGRIRRGTCCFGRGGMCTAHFIAVVSLAWCGVRGWASGEDLRFAVRRAGADMDTVLERWDVRDDGYLFLAAVDVPAAEDVEGFVGGGDVFSILGCCVFRI